MRNIKTPKKANITNLSKTKEKFSLPLFLPFLALLLPAMLIGCAELNKAIEDMNQQLASLNPSAEQLELLSIEELFDKREEAHNNFNDRLADQCMAVALQKIIAKGKNTDSSSELDECVELLNKVYVATGNERTRNTCTIAQNEFKEKSEFAKKIERDQALDQEAKNRYKEFIEKIDSLESAEEILSEAEHCNGAERAYCMNKAIEKDYVWARLAFIGENLQKENEKQNDGVEEQINNVLLNAKECNSEEYISSLMNMYSNQAGDFPQRISHGEISHNIYSALEFIQDRLQNIAQKETAARLNDESFIYPVRSQCNSEYPLYKDFKSGMNKAVCLYYIFDSEEKKIPNMKGKTDTAHENSKLGCYISSCGPTSINMDKNDNIPYINFIFAHKQKNAKNAILVGVDLRMLSDEITFEDLVEKYAKQFNVTPEVKSKYIKTIDNFTSEVSVYEKSVEINANGISCKIYATTAQVKYTNAFEMLNDGDKAVSKERLKGQLITLTRIKTIQILDHNQLTIFQDLYKEAKAKEDAQKQKELEEKKQKALDF